MWRHRAVVGVRGSHRLLWQLCGEALAGRRRSVQDVTGKERFIWHRRLSSAGSGKGGRCIGNVVCLVRMQFDCR